MTKITTSTGQTVYMGFSDEGNALPASPVEGSLYILVDKLQIWIARNSDWTFLMPMNIAMSVPWGGIPDGIAITLPGGTTVSRSVVALGSSLSGTNDPAFIEQFAMRIEDRLAAILAELKVNNILTQGTGSVPVTDDLDQLRASVLTTDETITR